MNTEKILEALIVISIVLAAIFTFWYIFGKSPTTDQVLYLYVFPLYGFAFFVYDRFNKKYLKREKNFKVH